MRASRDQLPILFGAEPAAIHGADWGDLRSIVISLPAGTDLSPLLQGLPNNLCSCPHWGYVLKGQMRVTYANSEEVLRVGDLFYLPAGHTGLVEADFEAVEFSPPAEHQVVLDVVAHNAAAAETATALR
jgi:EutQ-like cupin domain